MGKVNSEEAISKQFDKKVESVELAYGLELKEVEPNSPEALAKTITQHGKTSYYLKVGTASPVLHTLYNKDQPIATNKTSINHTPIWQFKKASKIAYLHYLSYLERDSLQQYREAQRKFNNGEKG